MIQRVNTANPEVVLRGDLWLNLVCGHKLRTEISKKDMAGIPLNLQWCPFCSNGRSEDRQYECDQRDNNIRTVNGKKMFLWRGTWRPW